MIAETSPQLIIASHNAGKIKEFQQVLGTHWRVQPQADFGVTEAEETGSTFVENALIKARHACSLTGHAALADDSGLVVPALDGAPGLRSARYSGSSYTLSLLLAHLRAKMWNKPVITCENTVVCADAKGLALLNVINLYMVYICLFYPYHCAIESHTSRITVKVQS